MTKVDYKGCIGFRCTPSRVIVSFRSPLSGTHEHGFNLTDLKPSQILDWQSGVLIQAAMPKLSAEDREMFLSGLTPAEIKEVFGDSEVLINEDAKGVR